MSAPIRQLSLSQIPVFLLNSRLGLCSAAYSRRHPFSRSYGVILPSSLTRVLPFVSGFSPRPPASVSGTGTFGYTSTFSRQRELTCFPTCLRSRLDLSYRDTYFTISQTCLGNAVDHHRAHAILLCQCFIPRWCRNLHLLSIGYDICPHLRSRLTLGG